MKKSKYVFAIMAAVYLGVAIAGSVGWLIITENILLGLSLSALLSAVSDIFYNIGYRYIINNDFKMYPSMQQCFKYPSIHIEIKPCHSYFDINFSR